MSNNLDGVLVKRAHKSQSWKEDQLIDFAKCADQAAGPYYFMDNFFYIQHPVEGMMLYKAYKYQ